MDTDFAQTLWHRALLPSVAGQQEFGILFLLGQAHCVQAFMFSSCHVLSLLETDRRYWEGKWLSRFLLLIHVLGHRSKWLQLHLGFRVLLQKCTAALFRGEQVEVFFSFNGFQFSWLPDYLFILFSIGSGLETTR